MNTWAVLLQGSDQPLKELPALLVPQLQDMAKGIHHRIQAAQPIEVALPVSALAPSHQLLVGVGEGG